MDLRNLLYLSIFCTCIIGNTVDSILPPHLRVKARLAPPKKKFKATNKKCCKIGERTARKRYSCKANDHTDDRQLNVSPKERINRNPTKQKKVPKGLRQKVAKCSVHFSKMFEKCCSYKATYYIALRRCKNKKKRERRRCIIDVKKKFS